MAKFKLITKIVLGTLIAVNPVFANNDASDSNDVQLTASTSDPNSNSGIVVTASGSIYGFIPAEETKVTKNYITALALDGLYRVYKAGSAFTELTAKHQHDINKIDATIACAFGENSLLDVTTEEFDIYEKCIKEHGMIDGNNNYGIVFDNQDYERFNFFGKAKSALGGPSFVVYKDPFFGGKYYGKVSTILGGEQYSRIIYPAPLALIYWGIKNIGINLLDNDDRMRQEFVDITYEIIKLINKRKSIGELHYVNIMETKLKRLQELVDRYSKKRILADNTQYTNLANLHLTTEGATKLGQLIHEHVVNAYASSAMQTIEAKDARALASESLKILKDYNLDKPIPQSEREKLLDEFMEVFKEIQAYHSKNIDMKNVDKVRISSRVLLTEQCLRDYYNLDSKIINKDKDMLSDAFHIGRILQEGEGTKEYNTVERDKERESENKQLEENLKHTTDMLPGSSEGGISAIGYHNN